MSKSISNRMAGVARVAGVVLLLSSFALAKEPAPVREIFVPFDDLKVVLDAQPRRVLLTREEYDALAAKAKHSPHAAAPVGATLLAADYQITVDVGRARIAGQLELEVLEEGLHAVPLALQGAGLRSARLDEHDAAIGGEGGLTLFVEGRGRHTLRLDLVAPVAVDAAQQRLDLQLPFAPAGKIRLDAPGDVEIKSGAVVVARTVDADAGVTHFELLPTRGAMSIGMSLNNRLTRQQRVVIARSVLVDELTEAYQRLHATFSFDVLHGAAEQFKFVAPAGFEVTSVESPLLARWNVAAEGERKILEVTLREPTTEPVVLQMSAIRTPGGIEGWTLPKFEPLDVAGYVAVVGLFVEDRLQPQALQARGLIPIDTQVLTDTLPASLLASEPGAAPIRPIAAYYAPQAEFALEARLTKPAARVRATTNLLLVLEETGLKVRGGFALLPTAEKLFGCQFTVPAGWQVTEVTYQDGAPLAFERYDEKDGAARIEVRLPQGVPAGTLYNIFFRATATPPQWLDAWRTTQVEFPIFAIQGASQQVGAIAVQARDDLVVRPEKLTGLTPLDDNKKGAYGLEDVPTNLAYRFDGAPIAALLTVERIPPRITARAFSFLQIEPDELVAHYEIVYDVREARARQLSLLLPKETPAEVAIRGLDGVALKEFESKVEGDQRRWTASLQNAALGPVRLAVDFRQPRDAGAAEEKLPLVRAADVVYQSGVAAVEGSAELDVEIAQHPRKIDVGELVDAEYQPGRRLLGVFGFPGDSGELQVKVRRADGYELPAAIVQRTELVTLVAPRGVSQTAARFELKTKTPFLEVELPPEAELWSVYLDGQPNAPQRQGRSLLISLPPSSEATIRNLQIVYELPVAALTAWGRLSAPAPQLRFRAARGAAAEALPVADLVWHLHLPSGYRFLRSQGTVFTDETPSTRLPAFEVAEAMFTTGTFLGVQAAREAGRRSFGPAGAPLSKSQAPFGGEQGETMTYDGRDVLPTPADEALAEAAPPPAAPAPTSEPVVQKVEESSIPLEDAAKKPQTAGGPASANKYWALEGVRSLQIELDDAGHAMRFQSLGADPRLDVTLVNQPRLGALGWGVALAVVVAGLTLTRRPWRTKLRLTIGLMLLGTVAPLLLGATVWSEVFNLLFVAGLGLLTYFGVAAFVLFLAEQLHRLRRRFEPVTATVVSLLLLMTLATSATAQEGARDKPLPPVAVPKDALIVPYDPANPRGVTQADTVLVPYDAYVKLWNAANPDKKLDASRPPAPYALAGAEFSTTLEGDDFLQVTGRLEIEVYSSEVVTVPLALAGGVLTSATIDGKPARLQIVQPAITPVIQAQKAAPPAPVQVEPLTLLYLSGKGRQRLELALRYPLERQGGWRVVHGRLPAAPATALTLHIPAAGTEVRLAQLLDRAQFETKEANEVVETAADARGAFGLQWRPRVSEAVVDQSLTVESDAVLDVQEDGLRLVQQVDLDFRRGQRDAFTILTPADYLVEKVVGANVRGWRLKDDGALEVTLLKAARERESFVVYLSRRGAVGEGAMVEFAAPVIGVQDAALHHGKLAIRRSPLLDVRIAEVDGLTRTDQSDMGPALTAALAGEESPLGIRPYQAYRFVATPYTLRLSAAPIESRVFAQLQSVLTIAERERSLESRILLRASGRPVYQTQLFVPADWKLEEVHAPAPFDWSVEQVEGRQLLTIYLTAGQTGEFPIVLRGPLGAQEPVKQTPLPTIEVRGVDGQTMDLVVQADPALSVNPAQLKNCQTVLLTNVYPWLQPQQRALARLAIRCHGAEYSGLIGVAPRRPRVFCTTVTNVRVTNRAFEETVLLDYTVREAGIDRVSFLLPAWMRDARIRAPHLRQKTIEPVEKDGRIRVTLELQDEVMGQFRVLVENDRMVTTAKYVAPLPIVEQAQTERRFVALESAGRDEVVVDEQRGLERLTREQNDWRWLAGLLGREMTHAYVVGGGDAAPQLEFHTQDRAAVETAGARIGLAQAVLTLDASGAYRAVQTYHMDNSTEQFLEVVLPEGAALWTASVAGTPVKPAQAAGAAGHVRIPLVKTAAGDQDFEVVLKYGGVVPRLATLRTVRFPLIRTANVNVELSQVRLRLPESHAWYNFDGTMRLVEEESDFTAEVLAYQTRQIKRLSELLDMSSRSSSYERVRARSNLQQLDAEVQQLQAHARGQQGSKQLEKELQFNTQALSDARRQIEESGEVQSRAEVDNRALLNDVYEQQQNYRSKNVADDLGGNFRYDVSAGKAGEKSKSNVQFNEQWFKKNRLEGKSDATATPGKLRGGAELNAPARADLPNQPVAPGFAQGASKEELRAAQQEFAARSGRSAGGDGKDQLKRYEAQLNLQQAQQGGRQTVNAAPPASRPTGGFEGEPTPEAEADRDAFDDQTTGWATSLASLDVDLPQRGVEYLLTTPRGEVEITARAIEKPLLTRMERLGLVFAAVVVGWLVVRGAAKISPRGRRNGAALLLVVGVGCLLLTVAPLIALLAIVVGLVLLVQRSAAPAVN